MSWYGSGHPLAQLPGRGAGLGISVESVRRRAYRNRRRRQEGNDGSVRVAVPVSVLAPATGTGRDAAQDKTPDPAALLAAKDEHIADLRRQLDHARTERTRLIADAQAERDRLLAVVEQLTAQLAPVTAAPDGPDKHGAREATFRVEAVQGSAGMWRSLRDRGLNWIGRRLARLNRPT